MDLDLDLDPERGAKWIRIRAKEVDPGGSGPESATLRETLLITYSTSISHNVRLY